MSIGTSIFLSVVLLSVVILFVATKDRWKWKKIIFYSVGSLIAVCLLAWGGLWLHATYSNRPQYQESFWSIPISASKSDVKFLKGEPSTKTPVDPDVSADSEWWDYEVDKSAYTVEFKGDKIHFIYYLSGEDPFRPYLQGITYGDSYNTVTQKLGDPSDVSISKNDLVRVLSFKKYGVFFVLSKNKVKVYGIYNPTFGPMKLKEEKERAKIDGWVGEPPIETKKQNKE